MVALSPGTQLADVGERRLIRDVLAPRYGADNVGDDCAMLPLAGLSSEHAIVLSTDPCPIPAASLLGFSDYYFWGWLLATINLSDIAAAGGRAVGLLTSLNLPGDLSVGAFLRLLDGIDDSCASVGARVLGGNLKEAAHIDLQGTSVGICESPPHRRSTALEGEDVFAAGPLGRFWSGFLGAQRLGGRLRESDPRIDQVLRPVARCVFGEALGRSGLASACMDNSDGLAASLFLLAEASGVQILVRPSSWDVPRSVVAEADSLGIDPLRLCLGWGDWQLVFTAPRLHRERILQLGLQLGENITLLGETAAGSGVVLDHNGRVGAMAIIESERFSKDSWLTAGIDAYVEQVTIGPLWS